MIWRPQALAVSPDGKLVYLANDMPSDGIVVFDANTLQRLYTLPAVYPYAIALSADGAFLYAISNPGNTVSMIGTKRKALVATINVGLLPNSLTLTPDGKKLFVGNSEPGGVTEIDTQSRRITRRISLGIVSALAASPDNRTVYVAQISKCSAFSPRSSRKDKHPAGIELVDVHTGKSHMLTDPLTFVSREHQHRVTDMSVTHRGDKLLCELADGNLLQIDTHTGAASVRSMAKSHTLETLAHGQLAISADDSWLYFTSADTRTSTDDLVCVISLAQSTSEATPLPGARGTLLGAIAISPDGKTVYVAGTEGVARFPTNICPQ